MYRNWPLHPVRGKSNRASIFAQPFSIHQGPGCTPNTNVRGTPATTTPSHQIRRYQGTIFPRYPNWLAKMRNIAGTSPTKTCTLSNAD